MRYIYFDFDGTIVDSFMLGIDIANILADKFHFSKVDVSKIDYYKGLTAQQLVKEFKIKFYKMFFLAPKFKTEIYKRVDLLKPYDGIGAVFELLSKSCFLGILTSNSVENVDTFLKNNNLRQYFSDIRSIRHLFGKHKSLKTIIKDNKIDKKQFIYIGDETRDIDAANFIGISSIAVTWGFNNPEILKRHKPTFIAHHCEEIPDFVEQYFDKNKSCPSK